MNDSISIGLDFGSLNYRAAYVLDDAVVPVPVPASDTTWMGSVVLLPGDSGGLTFTSLKYTLGTGQAIAYRGMRSTTEDVLKDMFSRIKQSVEEYAGATVDSVVVSVPARYSAFRRSELIKIVEAAGFGRVSLVNDCTAAAIGYTYGREDESLTLLVYSMGFVGFEVSLLRWAKGRLREIAHEGGESPSGRDLDMMIMRDCVDHFSARGTPLPTRAYRDHWFDLRIIAADAKHQLLAKEQVAFTLPGYITGADAEVVSLTRADFDRAIAEPIEGTMELVERILEDANLTPEDVDTVLLVGGTTRIGYIQTQLEEFMGPKLVQPREEVLARGAAIQSTRLAAAEEPKPSGPAVTVAEQEAKQPVSLLMPPGDSTATVAREPEADRTSQAGDAPDTAPLLDYARELAANGLNEQADRFLRNLAEQAEATRRELAADREANEGPIPEQER